MVIDRVRRSRGSSAHPSGGHHPSPGHGKPGRLALTKGTVSRAPHAGSRPGMKGGGLMRHIKRLAIALSSLFALLVAGGAHYKA